MLILRLVLLTVVYLLVYADDVTTPKPDDLPAASTSSPQTATTDESFKDHRQGRTSPPSKAKREQALRNILAARRRQILGQRLDHHLKSIITPQPITSLPKDIGDVLEVQESRHGVYITVPTGVKAEIGIGEESPEPLTRAFIKTTSQRPAIMSKSREGPDLIKKIVELKDLANQKLDRETVLTSLSRNDSSQEHSKDQTHQEVLEDQLRRSNAKVTNVNQEELNAKEKIVGPNSSTRGTLLRNQSFHEFSEHELRRNNTVSMPESLYNHFRPVESNVPIEEMSQFLYFGQKLHPEIQNTTSSNSVEVTPTAPPLPVPRRRFSMKRFSTTTPIPVPKLEEIMNEEMNIAVENQTVEKNKISKMKNFFRNPGSGSYFRKYPGRSTDPTIVTNVIGVREKVNSSRSDLRTDEHPVNLSAHAGQVQVNGKMKGSAASHVVDAAGEAGNLTHIVANHTNDEVLNTEEGSQNLLRDKKDSSRSEPPSEREKNSMDKIEVLKIESENPNVPNSAEASEDSTSKKAPGSTRVKNSLSKRENNGSYATNATPVASSIEPESTVNLSTVQSAKNEDPNLPNNDHSTANATKNSSPANNSKRDDIDASESMKKSPQSVPLESSANSEDPSKVTTSGSIAPISDSVDTSTHESTTAAEETTPKSRSSTTMLQQHVYAYEITNLTRLLRNYTGPGLSKEEPLASEISKMPRPGPDAASRRDEVSADTAVDGVTARTAASIGPAESAPSSTVNKDSEAGESIRSESLDQRLLPGPRSRNLSPKRSRGTVERNLHLGHPNVKRIGDQFPSSSVERNLKRVRDQPVLQKSASAVFNQRSSIDDPVEVGNHSLNDAEENKQGLGRSSRGRGSDALGESMTSGADVQRLPEEKMSNETVRDISRDLKTESAASESRGDSRTSLTPEQKNVEKKMDGEERVIGSKDDDETPREELESAVHENVDISPPIESGRASITEASIDELTEKKSETTTIPPTEIIKTEVPPASFPVFPKPLTNPGEPSNDEVNTNKPEENSTKVPESNNPNEPEANRPFGIAEDLDPSEIQKMYRSSSTLKPDAMTTVIPDADQEEVKSPVGEVEGERSPEVRGRNLSDKTKEKDDVLPIMHLYNTSSIFNGTTSPGSSSQEPGTQRHEKKEDEKRLQTTRTKTEHSQGSRVSQNTHSKPTEAGVEADDSKAAFNSSATNMDGSRPKSTHQAFLPKFNASRPGPELNRTYFDHGLIASRPPDSVNISEVISRRHDGDTIATQETVAVVSYILATLVVFPIAVGVGLILRKLIIRNRKVLEESDTSSEISCRKGALNLENGEFKSSIEKVITKLPRIQHLCHEAEKPPTPPSQESQWEFPRDKLRLQTVLGQGNFGQVWKAEADDLTGHQGTTRLVAVKTVKEGASAREKEDLVRELEIMQQLGNHPNVVTLLGCCTEEEPHYLILEYVMYGKLLAYLRDHRTRQDFYNFSEDSAALTSRDLTVFGYCVARGMEYLASKKIIHRDLAARNVLVDHNKLCKIADFGMSRFANDEGEVIEARHGRNALPIRWMAPESLIYSLFTTKTDVWSFGILMWEIVTLGSTPYPDMTAREVMRNVQNGYRLERPSHCRSELFRVISRCWQADPDRRPDFQTLRRDLAQLLEDNMNGHYVDLESFASDCTD